LTKAGFDFIVKGRPKSIYSIWNKIKKQNIHFEDIYDLFAIRIIIKTPIESEKAGCWRVYSMVTDIYKPNPDRLRDWISTPRSNGYESLHTTVMSKAGQWVEVQIRTERMDEIAEKGYAAHWKYKDNAAGTQGTEKGIELWFSKIRDMLSNTSMKGSLDFVDEFKSNLFSEEVFVFTPKGELRVLPNGATALDFAFEIHSQIGAKCLGAKVNQKLVPLSYVMNNGDQIEILTSNKQHPNEDWLNFVTTSKARAKIKDYLKEEVRTVAAEGKEMAERRLRNLKIDFTNENINRLANFFKEKTSQDLFYKVAKGNIDLKNFHEFNDVKEEKPAQLPKGEKQDVKKVIEFESIGKKSPYNELLFGENKEKLDYTLAKCCNPIPGDDVFGFITINEGIKIHRTTCPNAIELGSHYGYRILKAKWISQNEIAFLTGLTIKGADKVGMANDITRIISNEYKVNMRSVNFETDDGMFDGKIMLYVHDTQELEKLIKKLMKVPGVISVSRHDS
jgi:GTP diphosphokinase / guanosine-3',5'-bis(diphosphate) 3'-diphosphatase